MPLAPLTEPSLPDKRRPPAGRAFVVSAVALMLTLTGCGSEARDDAGTPDDSTNQAATDNAGPRSAPGAAGEDEGADAGSRGDTDGVDLCNGLLDDMRALGAASFDELYGSTLAADEATGDAVIDRGFQCNYRTEDGSSLLVVAYHYADAAAYDADSASLASAGVPLEGMAGAEMAWLAETGSSAISAAARGDLTHWMVTLDTKWSESGASPSTAPDQYREPLAAVMAISADAMPPAAPPRTSSPMTTSPP